MNNLKKYTKCSLILLGTAFLFAVVFSSCGKECRSCKECKDLTVEELSITKDIQGVIIEGPWEVNITQDSSINSASIEYCSSAKDKVISILLPNGYLHIKISTIGHSHCYSNIVFRANINAVCLEKIEASGAADIRTYGHFCSLKDISLSGASSVNGLSCEGFAAKIDLSGASILKAFTFFGNSIDAEISGASEMRFNTIDIDYCAVNLTGASIFSGGGYAVKTIFDASGASDFKTFNLESENLDIDLSGASEAEVTVNNTIKGRITGASTLRYRGGANVSGVSTSGASSIKPL
jgi:hypothetical protein